MTKEILTGIDKHDQIVESEQASHQSNLYVSETNYPQTINQLQQRHNKNKNRIEYCFRTCVVALIYSCIDEYKI